MFYFHFFHYFLSPTFSVSLKLLVPHAFNSCLSGPSVCQILLREKQRNLVSDKATAWANHSPARARCLENCKLVPLLGHRQCPDGGEAVQIPIRQWHCETWRLTIQNFQPVHYPLKMSHLGLTALATESLDVRNFSRRHAWHYSWGKKKKYSALWHRL